MKLSLQRQFFELTKIGIYLGSCGHKAEGFCAVCNLSHSSSSDINIAQGRDNFIKSQVSDFERGRAPLGR